MIGPIWALRDFGNRATQMEMVEKETQPAFPTSQSIDNWPTLMIEAGDSVSLRALRMDMEWWFRASNHQVKIVLLAKLDRHGRKITLEKWVEIQPAASRLRPRTRSTTTLGPGRAQGIVITWAPGLVNTPTSHTITRGAL
ncbi:hypothetical protein B0T25DRAFT_532079 [Lasiosphaeria hispida]|uniref:Uncharacterized protein n=1 Tax=Lasiosphaeria hispida TaxID=260671 RepID=A0AAJ0HPN7_9PEZI|nr:hypothetical protein B0T25DRAFT_532079 [Lasiosphaeria hispida]